MKTTLLITTLFIGILHCFAQIDNKEAKVPFVSYWAVGDSYNFKVTKVKQQWKASEQTKNDSSSYVVNFKVLDSTAISYKIKWSYKTNLTDFNIPEALLEKFSKYQLTEVIYNTTEVGAFNGIENWKEISAMMKGLFTDLIDYTVTESNIDREAFEKIMKPLMDTYNSKEGIEQLVMNELHYFHFPFGVEFSASEPVYYVDELPNMIGGKPIRGDAKIYVAELNSEDSYCVLKQEMKLNENDTRDFIVAFFKKMNIDDKEVKNVLKTARYDITDNNSYAYYYNPGIPVKIETNRTMLMNMGKENGVRIDKVMIELIE